MIKLVDIISSIASLLETGVFGHIYLVALMIIAVIIVLVFLSKAPKETLIIFLVPVLLVFAEYKLIPSIFYIITWIILGLIFAFILIKFVGAE